jgi:hypothetical protein
MAPQDDYVRFSAALVFTVCGEWTSAEVNAAKAVDLGIGRHWFDLPFFNPLRDRAGFQEAVGGGGEL